MDFSCWPRWINSTWAFPFHLITSKNMGQIQKATIRELTRSQQQANWEGSQGRSSLCGFPFLFGNFSSLSPSLDPGMALVTELHNEDRQQSAQKMSVLWPEDWENGSPWADQNSREASFFPVLILFKSIPCIRCPGCRTPQWHHGS